MMEISRSGGGAGAVWFVSCPCVGSSPALCGPGPDAQSLHSVEVGKLSETRHL